jgi:multidrug efflux system membrane fusion protein
MKPFPIIVAALVCVTLYFVVLDRETLMRFASGFGPDETAEVDAAAADEEAMELAAEAEAERATLSAGLQALIDGEVWVKGKPAK